MRRSFVADESWGDMLEPARIGLDSAGLDVVASKDSRLFESLTIIQYTVRA